MKKAAQKWFLAVAFCIVLFGGPRRVVGKPQKINSNNNNDEEVNEELIAHIKNIEIKCASHEITIKIPTPHPHFNGMVYPQGLSKNSSCLREYESTKEFIEYTLPLRSCNTMTTSSESEEEYFNTIVLEPHPKLVTGHGRGFHVRCKYRRQEKSNMPTVTMKIYKNGQEIKHQGNESISIGDPLQFQILVHSNDTIPFMVTDCHVRDGLGWAEELLINSFGCPVDSEILPPFTYVDNKASVEFPAHKFPYSPTVYYSCSVKICKKGDDSCLSPVCQGPKNLREASFKHKRDANNEEPATIQVYNGLWVNEPPESTEADTAAEVLREKQARGEVLCFKQRDFALAIAISGLILMIAVILLLFILCLRRRRAFKSSSETGSSSIYSGSGTNFTGNTRGYTNTAYSHSSD